MVCDMARMMDSKKGVCNPLVVSVYLECLTVQASTSSALRSEVN